MVEATTGALEASDEVVHGIGTVAIGTDGVSTGAKTTGGYVTTGGVVGDGGEGGNPGSGWVKG